MEPMVFQPKSGGALPFLVVIAIVLGIGAFGVIRAMRAGGGTSVWILAGIVVLGLVMGAVVIQSQRRAGPITVGAENITGSGWSIPYADVRGVREDMVSSTQYSGGRPVVSTQRRLIVDTDSGARAVAHEASYDIEGMQAALKEALAQYRGRI
jgi:hypothetical protein